MGQAKQRGTFEERKTEAVERDQKRRMAMAEIERRRPSPKHVALMGMIAAMMQGHNALVQVSGVNTINEGDSACSASPATEG